MAIIFLIAGHFGEKLTINWLNTVSEIQFSPRFFVFDLEGNITTLYSTIGLGFCSLLLAIIASTEKYMNSRYNKFWRALSFIFLYLAIDEACSIHEELIPILRTAFNTRGLLFFPWVIPAAILLVVFLIVFRGFIANLPPRIRNLFLVAGAVYVGGAIGMELIGGYIADFRGFDNKAYWLASLIEELLEMFGIVVFIYGLLSYMKSKFTKLNFSVSFRQSK
ncbi:MAG: hypothetical protein QNJ55_02480 [Xenococcus sp. MO_188.B8]|nr:hypothetical protein [Xenococcus sp. MO_188.B8]